MTCGVGGRARCGGSDGKSGVLGGFLQLLAILARKLSNEDVGRTLPFCVYGGKTADYYGTLVHDEPVFLRGSATRRLKVLIFIVCSARLRVFKHSQNIKRPLLSASE